MKVYVDKNLTKKDAEEVIVITDNKELKFNKDMDKEVYITSSNIVAFTIK